MTREVDLSGDELVITGRVLPASNATFVGRIGDVEVVYKPVAGERPLWDFPNGTLAGREIAAYLVSEAAGWSVVPRTWIRDGPAGPGMVQLWREIDPEQDAVTLVPAAEVPETGWRHVLDGLGVDDEPVSLVHEDSSALRRMAVFDVVVNNADRKGGHVLPMPDGHRHGVDHGVSFHIEPKLRTVLWGWIGDPLGPEELAGLARVRAALGGELGSTLAEHLDDDEVEATIARCEALLADRTFPEPRGRMPAVPWPPF